MSRVLFLSVLVCSLGMAGCTSYPATGKHDLSALIKAERVEIFSLDPKSDPALHQAEPRESGFFHSYRILGSADIGPGPERVRLLEALQEGMNRGPNAGAACFFPRHGLRAVLGGVSTDYVICFECCWVHGFGGSAPSSATTSRAPLKVFNDSLQGHGVPLPPAL